MALNNPLWPQKRYQLVMCITTFPPWTRQFASQQRLRCVWSLKQPMLGGSWQQRNLGSWSKHVCSSVSLPSRPNRNHSNAMRSGNENCEFIALTATQTFWIFLSQHLNFNMDCGSWFGKNHEEVGKNLGEYSTNLDFPEVPARWFPTQIRAAAL